jgi:hypothetical protein
MIGVWALVAFVGVIIVWNAVFKRNIGEAMILGFAAVCAFALIGGAEDGGWCGDRSGRPFSTPCRRKSPSPGWRSRSCLMC